MPRVIDNGSYDIIMKNIEENSQKMDIKTVVRVNVDKDNYSNIEHMLDDLNSLNIDKVTVDFAARFETPCDKFHVNSSVVNRSTMAEYIKACIKMANSKGIKHSRRYADDTPCLAVVPRQFVIDPVGDLYKCAAFAGDKRFMCGSIYDDELNETYVDIVGHDAWQDCRECPYVPLCGGGCLFINNTLNGNFKKRSCQKALFDSLVMETIVSSLDRDRLSEEIEGMN